MAITIDFRGVFLFVTSGGALSRVLIPNAQCDVVPVGGSDKKHADDSKARPHYAGLLVVDRQVPETEIKRVEPLLGLVEVDKAAGDTCTLTPDFSRVPLLNRVTNSTDTTKDLVMLSVPNSPKDYGRHLAATVEFGSGEMASCGDSDLKWSFPETFNPGHGYEDVTLPLWLRWQSAAVAVRITIRDHTGVIDNIDVTDGQRVYIYNFDEPHPTVKELNEPEYCTADGAVLEDLDFKWLYQLLKPRNDDWTEWRRDASLPAPRATCVRRMTVATSPGFFTPNTSGCFGSRWGS